MPRGTPASPGARATTAPCNITTDATGQCDFKIKVADMSVAIQLCEDQHGKPASSTQFDHVDVFYKGTTHLSPNQPTKMTSTTCDIPKQQTDQLPAKPGQYEVRIQV